MLTPYEVYCTWLAINTHFKQTDPFLVGKKYNFVRSNGRINTNQQAFDKRPDRKLFNVAKFDTVRDVVVSYLSYVSVNRGNLPSIKDLLEWTEHETLTIRKWTGKIEALDHTLKTDLGKLTKFKLDYLIKPKTGYPKLIEKWLHGTISIETIILLGQTLGLFKVWAVLYKETPYYDILLEHLRLWNAYSFFLNINQERVKEIWDDWRFLAQPH
jgi:hypothetical protein